jgi:CheY-like chemotaxis protein
MARTEDLVKAKTILIVEDDIGNGEFLRLAVATETSYRVYLVTSAKEALEAAKRLTPDLFLLDYCLPSVNGCEFNGIELYDHLHAMSGLEDSPAIIISASLHPHLEEIKDRSLIGLSKPVELDALLSVITRLLER